MDGFTTTLTGKQFDEAVDVRLRVGVVGKPEVNAAGRPLCSACARLSADLAPVRAA
jgi:hypothetical protein